MEENVKTTMTDPDDGVNSYIPAMEDETGNLFNLHSVGLDMNRSKDNMALLMLDTLSFEMIPASF